MSGYTSGAARVLRAVTVHQDVVWSPDAGWHPTHSVEIADRGPQANYRYYAACACGWRSRGYVTMQAARIVGDDHMS